MAEPPPLNRKFTDSRPTMVSPPGADLGFSREGRIFKKKFENFVDFFLDRRN